MRTTSLRELELNLRRTIESVNLDHEPVMVTGESGETTAVLMSGQDYAALEETAYLLRSPRNAERLTAAIERLERGLGTEREIPE